MATLQLKRPAGLQLTGTLSENWKKLMIQTVCVTKAKKILAAFRFEILPELRQNIHGI